jgi:hypothetical protein
MTVSYLDIVAVEEIFFRLSEPSGRHITEPRKMLIVIGDEPILVYEMDDQGHENAPLGRGQGEGSREPVVGP